MRAKWNGILYMDVDFKGEPKVKVEERKIQPKKKDKRNGKRVQ